MTPYFNEIHNVDKCIFITDEKVKNHCVEKVFNQGTIILWNDELDPDIFPYTGGYYFI